MTAEYHHTSIQRASTTHFHAITQLWEASVRATHHFLKEKDIQFIKPLLQNEFLKAVDVYIAQNTESEIIGFLGVLHGKVEMLFVHPKARGCGVGKQLLHNAITQLDCNRVDVNEQNELAVGFYKHYGFVTIGRTETDGLGMPYPILQMQLQTG